ncbi:MAG TPA: undecaprenyldiphospho-muramoylpentapeptide beta-N-acetylglucosaminyltransferase [Terriglobia bacterium]|nr:undecaprenyldiphospho-muramoylpentapeptide beta-N-acetylglucosaminyltransferase [Terriglobia bacterium]
METELAESAARNLRLEKRMIGKKQSPTQGLRVLMAAGGTGGHIFPALAVARELQGEAGKQSGGSHGPSRPEIVFLGTDRGLESRVIPEQGFALRVVAAAGLKNMGVVERIRNLLILPKSAIQSASILRAFRPHVVVGMGGYLAGPVMLEAALVGIPTLLIEPNAVPGFTNRWLAPFISLAAVGFEASSPFFGKKARRTGHPVRRSIAQVPRKDHVAPMTLLIVGGSQGSVAINNVVIESLPLLAKRKDALKIIHQSGSRDYERVRAAYAKEGIDAEVRSFVDDMAEALSRADLVVSRAGAMTVAELAAAGRASILIPLPSASDNHQLANARVLANAGGAKILEQHDLNPSRFYQAIVELLDGPSALTAMETNARKIFIPGAAKRIADLILELARL